MLYAFSVCTLVCNFKQSSFAKWEDPAQRTVRLYFHIGRSMHGPPHGVGVQRLSIVSRGEWLGNTANFKGDAYCLAFDVETVRHVTLTVHTSSNIPNKHGGRQRSIPLWR